MDIASVQREIEHLSVQRQDLWFAGQPPGAQVDRLTSRLRDAFEEKRAAVAQHGTERKRKRRVDEVAVERELERLIERA